MIDSEYIVNDVLCDDHNHKVLVGISAVLLTTYLGFLTLEQLIFSSQRFKSELPWAGFSRDVPHVRSVLKLILVASFVFGKSLSSKGHALICLGCALLSLYTVTKRLTTAVQFRQWIHYTSVGYDIWISLLLLAMPI